MKKKKVFLFVLFAGWTGFSACNSSGGSGTEPEPGFAGVSLETALDREARVSSLHYDLEFNIPAGESDPITGQVRIRFTLIDPERGIEFDFKADDRNLTAAVVNGRSAPLSISRGQIQVPSTHLADGENQVEFAFIAGDGPLNRRDDYLYSLFVPDRASETFPCFDQPGLKGQYRLTLNIPATWQAVSNAPSVREEVKDNGKQVEFSETAPISSYLFAFTAGKFQVEEALVDGRTLRFFHRETDAEKLARNRDALFQLHGASLRWLQNYAGIEYPFGKFEFILIPSFQFGGMEHPGAILYKDSSLLLEESATQSQLLGRASLIAHETAHMWFGNLVTMRWFNDVWMKEVFANFMAAKMVNPSFPETDHELRFLLNHHPTAYEVDRSEGTHPIRQDLANMNDAASLYGAIIYQKAPVVMQQLELLTGEESFREGIREYLRRYSFGNADWNELIEILDGLTERDLRNWSRRWVEEPGRPSVVLGPRWNRDRELEAVVLEQRDPLGMGRTWTQKLRVDIRTSPFGLQSIPVVSEGASTIVPLPKPVPSVSLVTIGAQWFPYGRFVLDSPSRQYLVEHLQEIEPAVDRAAGWLTLWDSMLEGETEVNAILEVSLDMIRTEKEELLLQQVISNLGEVFWRYLDEGARRAWSTRVEEALWERLNSSKAPSMKSTLFKGLVAIAWSDETLERLARVWSGEEVVEGLTLGENDLTDLALELAARHREAYAALPAKQLEKVENPERRERLNFLIPAVSSDPAIRERFAEGLRLLQNRGREPWVLSGLHYLHHPANHPQSVKFVSPQLMMLETIRETGSIFFPKRWADEVLWSYGSPEIAAEVRAFLQQRPKYPERLKGKLLQAADGVFRAADLKKKRADRQSE